MGPLDEMIRGAAEECQAIPSRSNCSAGKRLLPDLTSPQTDASDNIPTAHRHHQRLTSLSAVLTRSGCEVDRRRLLGQTSKAVAFVFRAAMTEANTMLPFWQRLLATIVAILVASFLAGLAWEAASNFAFPSYAAGMVGGLAALPVWDFLKRIRPLQP